MGSYQSEGPGLGTLNNRCRIMVGTQKRDPNFDNHPCACIAYAYPKYVTSM